jgi:hypothetical protein
VPIRAKRVCHSGAVIPEVSKFRRL